MLKFMKIQMEGKKFPSTADVKICVDLYNAVVLEKDNNLSGFSHGSAVVFRKGSNLSGFVHGEACSCIHGFVQGGACTCI